MNRKNIVIGVSALTAGALAMKWRWGRRMDLDGRVVLITGGSRGLGLALAREFSTRGCRLAICARSEEELEAARRDLSATGVDVLTVVCDVSDPNQVDRLVEATLQHYGRIDVLINNAGVIQVGPVGAMTLQDFRTAMDVMFWGGVYTTFAALPQMLERGEGRVVNITSIGAKVSVPHLTPYSCAKFASAAFSEGMRAELQGTGVKVVTIAPGLMRTGSHLNAIFKGAEQNEAAWFSLSASLPGISMGAKRAAKQIVSATVTGRAERILTTQANLLATFHGLFPGATADILGLINRALPHGSQKTARGADSPVLQKPLLRALTTLGRKAAEEFLQPGAGPPAYNR